MITSVCKVQRLDSPAAKTFLWDKRLVFCRKESPDATRWFGGGERNRERDVLEKESESGSGT